MKCSLLAECDPLQEVELIRGRANVEKIPLGKYESPQQNSGNFIINYFLHTKFSSESPERADRLTVKDGFFKNNRAGGETVNRGSLFGMYVPVS